MRSDELSSVLRARALRWALLPAIFAVACGGGAPSAAPRAADDAAAAFIPVETLPEGSSISDAYRFALRPTEGWRILSEDELGRLGPSAAGGAQLKRGTGFAAVVVEAIPGMSLERAAELTATVFGPNASIEEQSPTRFRGFDAIRLRIVGSFEGMPIQWTSILFMRDGHLYRLTLWGRDIDPENMQAFYESFALLEGTVMHPPRRAVQNAAGVDWRVVDGRFESLTADVTVASGGGWRVVVEAELAQLHDEAAVGLVHEEPDVYAMILAEPTPPAHHETWLRHFRGMTAQNLGVAPSGSRTVPFAERDLSMSIFEANGFEYLYGARCDGDRCRQLLVWYVPDAAADAARALARMPAIEPLSDARRDACRDALRRLRRVRRVSGDGYAFRGRRYLDFERGLRMEVPAGSFWTVSRGGDEATRLTIANQPRGLTGVVVAEDLQPGAAPEDFHRAVLQAAGVASPSPLREQRFGDRAWIASTGLRPFGFGTWEVRVFTAIEGTRGYRFVVSGWPEHVAEAAQQFPRLLAAMELEGRPLPRHRWEGERFVDEHFGMAITPPPGGEYGDFTSDRARGLSVVHGFAYPDGSIVQIFAMRASAASSEASRHDIVRRMTNGLQERMGAGVPSVSEIRFAGQEGTLARFSGSTPIEMRVVTAGELGYGLLVMGRNDTPTISQAFELLDPPPAPE